MQGKELLKHFMNLPEQEQNVILINAYRQIEALHGAGKSFDSFGWQNCQLENAQLKIDAPIDDHFDEESFERNLLDYAKVAYCLTTGSKSPEAMSWDAGRKIKSNVIREIVLTICGRNDSVEPLIKKLKQPYEDEDTFFSDYTTVEEKECREAYEKQKQNEARNREEELRARLSANSQMQDLATPWWSKVFKNIWYFIIIALCVGGVRACKYSKEIKQQQAVQQQQMILNQHRQMRQEFRNNKLDLSKELNSTGHNSDDGGNDAEK